MYSVCQVPVAKTSVDAKCDISEVKAKPIDRQEGRLQLVADELGFVDTWADLLLLKTSVAESLNLPPECPGVPERHFNQECNRSVPNEQRLAQQDHKKTKKCLP